jgi:DNA-binding protein YbaB
MMKNQLAGLMKQAQQMQENMQKAQEELARSRSKVNPARAWSKS